MINANVQRYFARFKLLRHRARKYTGNPENIFTILVTEKLEERGLCYLRTYLPQLVMISIIKSGKSHVNEICLPGVPGTYQCKLSTQLLGINLNLAEALKNTNFPDNWDLARIAGYHSYKKELFRKCASKDSHPFEICEIDAYIFHTVTRKVNTSLYKVSPEGSWEGPISEKLCDANQKGVMIPRIQ